MINNFGNLAEDKTVSSTGSNSATAPNSSAELGDADGDVQGERTRGRSGNPAPTVTCDLADVGDGERRNGGDHHGHGLPDGSDGEPGGTAATGVTVVSSTTITATTRGACGGSGECGGHQHRQPERDAWPAATPTRPPRGGSISFVQVN